MGSAWDEWGQVSIPPWPEEPADEGEAFGFDVSLAEPTEPDPWRVRLETREKQAALGAVVALRRIASHEAQADLAIGRGLRRLLREFSLSAVGHSWPDDFAVQIGK